VEPVETSSNETLAITGAFSEEALRLGLSESQCCQRQIDEQYFLSLRRLMNGLSQCAQHPLSFVFRAIDHPSPVKVAFY